ncbi:TIGR03862 family flavoprotein [Aromatoleum toluvorans]|uniref:TIGR03862 family flavoprotein n=1 Tax=Aromatoleum toluvorans TaxID=92002 RepID=A0ABX1Q380_9RHOO|nr:TIGR03862 family flavoprotein [Aromatoleum toluvorans]NMG45865.1 TIGR03862 family flavoprotein [Aromatoleum toluvorans]
MTRSAKVAVIGGGPAGLMAAEMLADRGVSVDVYDAMPSPGRKFLLAGIGGLNLTHSEPSAAFLSRYRERESALAPMLAHFGAAELRAWAHALGIETFVGSSGRVFPTEMKAAPLLRAWLHRLRAAGVRLHVRHRWLGWQDSGRPPTEGLRFATPEGEQLITADAVILALGGASWAKLGSDGAWLPWLTGRGVAVAPLLPANCGFDVGQLAGNATPGWSEHFRGRFVGQPVKSVAARFTDAHGKTSMRAGECMISASGIEGGLIYALSAPLRDAIAATGAATLHLDLAPGRSLERLSEDLSRPRGARSMASHLQSKAGIEGVKAGLLRECTTKETFADPARLAAAIKALPVRLAAPRPLDEAISTAGGVRFEDLDERLMVRALPGLFCCGEMLDWEAPTGGYLLTACFATGRAAGVGAAAWLDGPK